jgi:F-type H+-transporting ATPase subunit b
VLLDPITVVAQVVNFLVLVVVLKYVLYDRIIAAMDARERHIAECLAAAALGEREAAEEAARARADRDALAAAREELLDEARTAADRAREGLIADARADVDEQRRRWTGTLEREQQRLLLELQERAGRTLVAIGRRALRDLADAALEDQAVTIALRELERDGAVARLAERAAADGHAVEIHTAFPLSADRRETVTTRLTRLVGERFAPTFAVDPGLVCGLEVRVAGEAVGWSLAGYLDELARAVDQALPTTGPTP